MDVVTDAIGGFMGGDKAAEAEKAKAEIFKAIVEGAVQVGGPVVLSPMIMEMQRELNKEET